MPKTKSLLIRAEPDVVKRAHNCQGNRRHRLQAGERRLKVRQGRSWEYYCGTCASAIVAADLRRLDALAANFE